MSPRAARTFEVLGYASTHQSLAAERLLKDLGVPVTPIPAPKSLGGSVCGIALRLEPADAERAALLLDRAGLAPRARMQIEDV